MSIIHLNIKKSFFNRRFIYITFLILLTSGYLIVNLFNFSNTEILVTRSVAFSLLIALAITARNFTIQNKSILIFCAISLAGTLTSSISLNLFFIAFTLIATKNINIYTSIKYSTYMLGSVTLISLILLYLGVTSNTEDLTGVTIDNSEEIRTRMTFGYKNVNAFTAVVSAFSLLTLAVNERIFFRYLISLTTCYIFYIYTDSRTMLLATIAAIIASELSNLLIKIKREKLLSIICLMIIICPPIITLFPFIVTSQIKNIDILLSGRLSFISAYYNDFQLINFLIGGSEPTQQQTIDNSFALIIGAIGIPFFVYLLIKIIHTNNTLIKSSNHTMIGFLIGFWLYSFSESSMVRPESIIGLIFWMLIFGNSKQYTKEVK